MSEEIINEEEMRLIQERLAAQLMESIKNFDNVLFIGIERRGSDLARRLVEEISRKINIHIPCGKLDINLYRDDWTRISRGNPHIGRTELPESPDGKKIILVDDVLFSGRTIRAAMEAILDYGRPESIELLVFVDRGHRELPIYAKYIGRNIKTEKNFHIDVLFREHDGRDAVVLNR